MTPKTLSRMEATILVMDGTTNLSMKEYAPVLRAMFVISSLAVCIWGSVEKPMTAANRSIRAASPDVLDRNPRSIFKLLQEMKN
ncbi:hypothetical protein ES703_85007 [subsurface metagenome]